MDRIYYKKGLRWGKQAQSVVGSAESFTLSEGETTNWVVFQNSLLLFNLSKKKKKDIGIDICVYLYRPYIYGLLEEKSK